MIMFIVGVTVNTMVNMFGWLAVEESRPLQIEFRPNALDVDGRGPNKCGHLVISITSDGDLYLNKAEMGTLKDTDQLKARLVKIFVSRTEQHVYRDSFDVWWEVPKDRQIEKTVFIKAPRSMSYGEVTDLIKVVREAGADPIGLVSY